MKTKAQNNQQETTKSQTPKRKKKRKNVKLPKYSMLNKRFIKAFDCFVETTPAARLSKNLRDLFLLYQALEKDGLPIQFDEFVTDLYFLMQFLDVVEEEIPESMY